MTERRFRLLILFDVMLLLAALIVGFVPGGYSQALAAAYAEEPAGWLFANGWIPLAFAALLLCMALAGYVGLFLLRRWGRTLALASTVASLPLYPLMGPVLMSPLEAMLADTAMLLWGVILAIAWCRPVAARFAPGRGCVPPPDDAH